MFLPCFCFVNISYILFNDNSTSIFLKYSSRKTSLLYYIFDTPLTASIHIPPARASVSSIHHFIALQCAFCAKWMFWLSSYSAEMSTCVFTMPFRKIKSCCNKQQRKTAAFACSYSWMLFNTPRRFVILLHRNAFTHSYT